jgi:hypothetical protein
MAAREASEPPPAGLQKHLKFLDGEEDEVAEDV